MTIQKTIKTLIAIILVLIFISPVFVFAKLINGLDDPHSFVYSIMSRFFIIDGTQIGTKNNSNSNHLSNGTRNINANGIILVKAPGDPAIYEIIKGQQHHIPNEKVFSSYGYKLSDVISMSRENIFSYPRAKLFRVGSDKINIYYLTEGNFIRLIPNKKTFNSYGDREEDVIVINETEFNSYPKSQYIFNEDRDTWPTRNVFRISKGTKKIVTSTEFNHLRLSWIQIAPVNQTEFDYYKGF